MTSPARAHYLRTVAAQSAAAGAPEPLANANAYELMLAQLAEHRRRLKQVQSIERKIEAKRAMLPDYAPWVEGVLAGDAGVQDDVLMTVLVWRIDTGDLAGALPLAEYALRHKLSLPDQYHRPLACLIAEESADLALRQIAAEQPVDVASLVAVLTLTAEQDMPDEVRARLLKALGYALRDSDKAGALSYLQQALARHEKVGVKKDIERLERELKKEGPADSPPATDQPPADPPPATNQAPATGEG